MSQKYGANAGAAIGTAIAPGVGTAIGGLFGSFLDGDTGGGGSPSAPMSASAAVYGSGLDGSGWAVNFSGLQSASSSPASAAGMGLPPMDAGLLGNVTAGLPNWFYFAAAGVLAWRLLRSKK